MSFQSTSTDAARGVEFTSTHTTLLIPNVPAGKGTEPVDYHVRPTFGPTHVGSIGFSFNSVGAATISAGVISQAFTGTFSLYDSLNNLVLTGTTAGAELSGMNHGNSATLVATIGNTYGGPASVFAVPPTTFTFYFTDLIGSTNGKTDDGLGFNMKQGTVGGFLSDISGVVVAAVPEPSTMALAGFGLAGLALAAYRRRLAV
jgi:hypothetical protein